MAKGEMQVSTFLVCNNPMLREGLKHILSDTQFRICPAEQITEDTDHDPALLGASALLFIVDANHDRGKPADRIRKIRVQYPSAKVVVLANHFEMTEMMSMLDAGSHGYCLATIGCEALVKSLELVMLDEIVFPAALFLSSLPAHSHSHSHSHEPIEAPAG